VTISRPTSTETLAALLAELAGTSGAQTALRGQYDEYTYEQLDAWVRQSVRALRAAGTDETTRVAVAVSEEPDGIVALLAAACAGVCAPMAPALTAAEVSDHLTTTSDDLVLVCTQDAPAAAVADSQGRPTLVLPPLSTAPAAGDPQPPPDPDRVCVVLATAGAPGRVPLREGELLATARAQAEMLRLTPRDGVVNTLPLSHIDAFACGVLPTLVTGGQVHCSGANRLAELPAVLARDGVTWCTAEPATLRVVVDRAGHTGPPWRHRLRFIRSASPLPPRLLAELQTIFGVPVDEVHTIPRTPRARGVRHPLSFGQERIWSDDRLAPNSVLNNVQIDVRLRGRLHEPALVSALRALITRHEVLRTVYESTTDDCGQVVRHPDGSFLDVPVRDVSDEPTALDLASRVAGRSFDLAAGPPVRTELLRLTNDDHLLVLVTHRIAADAWSVEVLLRELGELATPPVRRRLSATRLVAGRTGRGNAARTARGPAPVHGAGTPRRLGHLRGQCRGRRGAQPYRHRLRDDPVHSPAGGIPGAVAPIQRPDRPRHRHAGRGTRQPRVSWDSRSPGERSAVAGRPRW